tara:strand:- start:3102 stop:3455 length:354 start_codon:yes stop_codon:yes gene_type:complete
MTTSHIIDLTIAKKQLNESAMLRRFSADLKVILRTILSNEAYRALISEEEQEKPKIVVKGSKEDVKAFAKALENERQYALNYMKHGLGSKEVSNSKLELEKSIHDFESSTGIKWPIG